VTGSGMMGHGMMGGAGGMGALFGSRVVPTMNLSVDDVRAYLNRVQGMKTAFLRLGADS